MRLRFLRSLTLKQRVFGFVALLGLMPIASLASVGYLMSRSSAVGEAIHLAGEGSKHLVEIDAKVWAIVAESRGIYMATDQKTSERFAANLDRELALLKSAVKDWSEHVIEGERVAI